MPRRDAADCAVAAKVNALFTMRMIGAFLILASQALAIAAPAASAPKPSGARVSAVATAEILHAETTREDGGVLALNRHRRASAVGRVTIEFE